METTDVDKMKKAAQALVGTHDFASFCGNRHMKKSTVRTIFSIDLVERDGEIRSCIVAMDFYRTW